MSEENLRGVPASIRAALATGNTERILEAVADLTPEDAELLQSALGRDSVKGMQRKARRGRARALGKVVVTPGIVGSELACVEASVSDTIWVNLFRLFGGRIAELQMDSEGRSRKEVRVDGIRVEYLPLIVELSSRWDVLPFAYDWRESIDKAASRLDAAIADWAKGQPTHIIAHSMGGLVARRFIQHFGQRWDSMNDSDGKGAGGRLVMLGTPNHGSFAVSLMLSGAEKLLKWLEVLDCRHDMKELLKIIDSFHASYQMLPSPILKFGDDRLRLASKEAWGRLPVTQALLDQGFRFQQEIANVIDPKRMIYVAGYDRKTPWRIKIDLPGDFSYQHTMDGDGRVPHELGLLEGVPTYWLNEAHGDLPRNARLHEGIHDLLRLGSCDALESRRPRSRAVSSAKEGWQKGSEFYKLSDEERASLRLITGGRRAAVPTISERDAALLEGGLLEDYVGATPEQRRGPREPAATITARARFSPGGARRTLRVEVHCGDIARAEADVYAAGHYVGVEPQNAELALDCAVSGINWNEVAEKSSRLVLTQLTRRGVIKGELGDVNFYPFAKDRGRKRLVAIAGMGSMGTFGRRQLVRLAESIASATGSLPDAHTLGMVLIGSGVGGLRPALAMEAILDGVLRAISDSDGGSSIKTVKLVELQFGKALDLQEELESYKKQLDKQSCRVRIEISARPKRGAGARLGADYALALALSGLSMATNERSRADDRRAVGAIVDSLGLPRLFKKQITQEIAKLGSGKERIKLPELARTLGLNLRPISRKEHDVPTRLSVSWNGTNVVIAALTDVAVVPERPSSVSKALVDESVRRMVDPPDDIVLELGRKMNILLLPRDFRDILRESNGPVVFEVDREMAKVHWEMVAQDGARSSEGNALALNVQVARQLRTAYSAVPAPELPRATRLKALVIGDPGEPGDDLPGARREAMEVATVLDSCGVDVKLMIGAPGSPSERFKGAIVPSASMLDVLGELMDGGYDILHYAGHGDFDSNDPMARSGWLFKGGLLTARELERVDLAPRLVVANACLSGLTSDRVAGGGQSGRLDADLLPGLADEFFRRGARNYVGTAWEVDDLGAIEFAREIYTWLIKEKKTLGRAMLEARKKLAEQAASFGALWAAYQHYGSPGFTLTGPSAATSETATSVADSRRERRRQERVEPAILRSPRRRRPPTGKPARARRKKR